MSVATERARAIAPRTVAELDVTAIALRLLIAHATEGDSPEDEDNARIAREILNRTEGME